MILEAERSYQICCRKTSFCLQESLKLVSFPPFLSEVKKWDCQQFTGSICKTCLWCGWRKQHWNDWGGHRHLSQIWHQAVLKKWRTKAASVVDQNGDDLMITVTQRDHTQWLALYALTQPVWREFEPHIWPLLFVESSGLDYFCLRNALHGCQYSWSSLMLTGSALKFSWMYSHSHLYLC